MRIELIDIGKRFGRQWVLKDINTVIDPGSRICITGPNGSGKSTLLNLIAGYTSPNKGEVTRSLNGVMIERERTFKHLSIAAPYLDMYQDLSVNETIGLQESFKPLIKGIDNAEILSSVGLSNAGEKAVKDLSSGMKQRLKLALALHADTPLVLLDEPASNLDKDGIDLYLKAISRLDAKRTVIVCTNAPEVEAPFCSDRLELPH